MESYDAFGTSMNVVQIETFYLLPGPDFSTNCLRDVIIQHKGATIVSRKVKTE